MGLDCYVVTHLKEKGESQEIWYGRKENEIHGWMQRQSGIDADDFNCKEFPLTAELIDQFEADMLAGELTTTAGFFFGGANSYEEVSEAAQELIDAVREALADGETPYYYSWW